MANSSNVFINDKRAPYYEKIRNDGLVALWQVMGNFVTPEPVSPVEAAKWDYASIRKHLLEAGRLISAEEAERRVLVLENPGLAGKSLISRTLYAGFQLILPNEIAPPHRHTQNALRFVVEGRGAYTTVDGIKIAMEPYDLVLTPNMVWHEHGNASEQEMIWLDGLDLGLVQSLDGAFSERLPDGGDAGGERLQRISNYQPNIPLRRPFGPSGAFEYRAPAYLHYPYAQWREALEAESRDQPADRHTGWMFEFADPKTASAVMSTISAFAQKIPAGFSTGVRQTTESAVYFVVEGCGHVKIAGPNFALRPGDTFVVPPWAPVKFEARDDLVLFSYSDRVVHEKLGLWRERRH